MNEPRTIRQHLHLGVIHLGVIALAAVTGSIIFLAAPAKAEVAYTAVNVAIAGDGSIKLDLNHDGITDFTIHAVDGYTECYLGQEFWGAVTVTPALGNGVVANNGNAVAFGSGALIGPSQSFQGAQERMTSFIFGRGFPPCFSVFNGYWCRGSYSSRSCGVTAYLALEFKISGETHYGWALVRVAAQPGTLQTTLISFAYETVAGQAITTGQTSGP
jgi:hypothetical protein